MIIIVGSGPVGSYLARILAKAGKEVSIYEEHAAIGKPVQCTGIVTEDIMKLMKLDKKFVVNVIDKVRIFSKNATADIPIRDFIVDRTKFDSYLAKEAKKAGAKIFLNHKFIGVKGKNAVFSTKNNKIKQVEAEYIIGADGPLSEVAKSNNMFGKRDFFVGLQATVKGNYEANRYDVYLGSIAPDFFGWITPESKTLARVGIGTRNKRAKIKDMFDEFLEKTGIDKKDIIDTQAGLIPVYDPNLIVEKGNVLLIGDAAAQVKATTGGGIIPGFKAAKKLAKSIMKGTSYKKELKSVDRGLKLHLLARNILDRFSDKDYNKLVKTMGSKKLRKIMRENTRDDPKKLIFKTIIAKPSLLSFTTKFIK